jgi:hypothetical protein
MVRGRSPAHYSALVLAVAYRQLCWRSRSRGPGGYGGRELWKTAWLAYGDRNRLGRETAIARGNVAPFGKGHQGHRRNQKASPRFRR